ncbi:MAG: lipopolysaccharide assembly protein LapA domain-containing protein [Pseudomonadota bacterium]
MYKTIITIVVTIIGVLFAIQNFDHVPVFFLFGKAVKIRLIFVIATAGVLGYLIRHFIGIGREEQLKHRIYKLKRALRRNNGRKNGADHGLDEEIE